MIGATAVCTTRPPLAVIASAGWMYSPWATPMVRMTLSAIAPHVSSPTSAVASSMLGAVCVAPKICGLLPLELQRVDGDDVAGAGHRRALHGVHADAAAADDDHGLARLDVGGVDGRAPAGGDAAADESGLVERDVVLDLDAARRGRDRVLAERADAAHDPEVLAAGRGGGR